MWATALVLNVLHLLYHQVTTHVDFYPFNNIRNYSVGQRVAEASVNFVTMGFPIVALLVNTRVWVGIACLALVFILCGEFLSWWKGYFFGASEKWKMIYIRIHKSTITILPPRNDNPVPNLEHCILHVLTVITFIATAIYYLNRF